MRLARLVQAAANRAGFQIVRYDARSSVQVRRRELLASGAFDVLLDVGAAAGRWAAQARANGFAGRIVSFEPRRDAFEALARRAAADGSWSCHRVALGAEAGGVATLHLAGTASSLRPMTPWHEHVAPAPVGTEAVTVSTLDGGDAVRSGERAFLKADVQGHELEVLAGATRTLASVDGIELELSFVELYEGQPLEHEVTGWLAQRGYRLVGLDVIWRDDETGDLVSANGLYLRRC